LSQEIGIKNNNYKMDVKVIESEVNGSAEKVYLVTMDYGTDAKILKLTEKELKSFAKKLWVIVDSL